MPDRKVGREKLALLLKGELKDLMQVDPNTGLASFAYRKAKHFEEISKPTVPIPKHHVGFTSGKSPILKLLMGRKQ